MAPTTDAEPAAQLVLAARREAGRAGLTALDPGAVEPPADDLHADDPAACRAPRPAGRRLDAPACRAAAASLPPDHPDRLRIADEVHARPPEPLETPSRATYVAVLVEAEDRAAELAHLQALCAAQGVAGPRPAVTHFSATLGEVRLKWERHGEFSGYTFFAAGSSATPFDDPPTTRLPAGWLAALPGSTVVAAHAELLPAGAGMPTEAARLARHFEGQTAVGAEIGGGAGLAFTDFRIHADGCTRFLVLDRGFTPRQAGRMLQRLFEIEAYRTMALLALPIARRQSGRTVAIEKALAELTAGIAGRRGDGRRGDGRRGPPGADRGTDACTDPRTEPGADRGADQGVDSHGEPSEPRAERRAEGDEALLQQLTRLAAEVESELAASQFRFGACRAYFDLVTRRIAELRESRVDGIQTIEAFMARRLTPAVATCNTVSQRLHDLSERVAQASALLSTRVEIARERQNQALLGSMDRRARLQLRLQQTVEGLSVAAIVYYVAGLAGYAAKALKAAGVHLEPDLVVGAAIPAIALAVVLALRRARAHLGQGDADASPARATR